MFLVCSRNRKVEQMTHSRVTEKHEVGFNARKIVVWEEVNHVEPCDTVERTCVSLRVRWGGYKYIGEEVI